MNTATESIWPIVSPHAWKYARRTEPITTILIHATRSGFAGRSSSQEYTSTKNWFSSPSNRTVDSQGRVSAGMTNVVIGDRGKLCIALPDEYYPRWSAGHMDPEAWSIELAQATNGDPFDPLDLERCEHEVALKCRLRGIPAVCILYMHGDNREAPGIAFHDGSANGTALGKSDPGTQAPFNDRERWVRDQIAPLVSGGTARMYSDKEIDEKIAQALALGVRNQNKIGELADAQDAVTQHNDVQDKSPKLSLRGLYWIAGKAWPF